MRADLENTKLICCFALVLSSVTMVHYEEVSISFALLLLERACLDRDSISWENTDAEESYPSSPQLLGLLDISVTSIALIGFGLRTMIELTFISDVIGTRELTTTALLMLSLGTCTFASTPLGLFSVITKHNALMLTYMLLIFFVCLLSAVCGWLGFNLYSEVNSGVILHWMNNSFLNEYGNPKATPLTHSWDEMQRKYACCGITDEKNSAEWRTTHWFIAYETWPRPRVPKSCCATCETVHSRFCNSFIANFPEDGVLDEDQKACVAASYVCSDDDKRLANEDACQGRSSISTPRETYMHVKGCYAPLKKELLHHINCIIYACLLMFVVATLSTCFWFFLHEASISSRRYRLVLLPNQ